ncbi:MAG TPA: 3-hydroxyacyl-CoA dehydrogenase NAD-binding domain-containing protein, partial [Roseiarcus sp.]
MTDKAAVIASGLIGRGWATSVSRAGYDVALYDAALGCAHAALGFIDTVLADLHRDGLLNGNAPDAVRGRIKVAPTVADA